MRDILTENDKKSIFFVVPEHNEGAVIRSTLEPVIREGYSVVVVDDGSSDGSWEKIKALPVYALRHRVNLGQGAALQTGMTFALSKGAEIIVHFDADGQHRLIDVKGLLEPILAGEADVALGSRFLRRDDKRAVPLSKRVLLKMAVLVNGLMTGLWLTDAHNGLRVLNRRAAESIFLLENGYAHATEIINQIRHLKLRYVEKPTRVHYSKYSRSKGQSMWNAVNIFIDLLLRRVLK
jgi:polyprenyl-phospho-N-acetylgalactosaminyl synthase